MPTVYIETSIIGYLTARSAADLLFQARQELTRRWWNDRRFEFDLYISQLVVDESAAGDSAAAIERLELLDGLPLIDTTPEVDRLANVLLANHLLPKKGGSGCTACCYCDGWAGRLSVDLELQAYCKRRQTSFDL